MRKHCTTIQLPDDLIQLCFVMYFITIDQWIAANGFNVSHKNKVAHFNGPIFSWRSIFGSLCIKKGDIQTWKLKRYKATPTRSHFGIIGIMDANNKNTSKGFFPSSDGPKGFRRKGN